MTELLRRETVRGDARRIILLARTGWPRKSHQGDEWLSRMMFGGESNPMIESPVNA
jgi:hypothetical protein